MKFVSLLVLFLVVPAIANASCARIQARLPKNIPIIWLGATAWTMLAWKVEGRGATTKLKLSCGKLKLLNV